jgi:hypothetical protein
MYCLLAAGRGMGPLVGDSRVLRRLSHATVQQQRGENVPSQL